MIGWKTAYTNLEATSEPVLVRVRVNDTPVPLDSATLKGRVFTCNYLTPMGVINTNGKPYDGPLYFKEPHMPISTPVTRNLMMKTEVIPWVVATDKNVALSLKPERAAAPTPAAPTPAAPLPAPIPAAPLPAPIPAAPLPAPIPAAPKLHTPKPLHIRIPSTPPPQVPTPPSSPHHRTAATPKPATPQPVTPKPATPRAATPKPVTPRAATPKIVEPEEAIVEFVTPMDPHKVLAETPVPEAPLMPDAPKPKAKRVYKPRAKKTKKHVE
jgi:hypothetical protein